MSNPLHVKGLLAMRNGGNITTYRPESDIAADVGSRRRQRGEMQSRDLVVVVMIVQSSVCPDR